MGSTGTTSSRGTDTVLCLSLRTTFLAIQLWWLHALLQAIPVALLPQASSDEGLPVRVASQQLLRGDPLGTRKACVVERALTHGGKTLFYKQERRG